MLERDSGRFKGIIIGEREEKSMEEHVVHGRAEGGRAHVAMTNANRAAHTLSFA